MRTFWLIYHPLLSRSYRGATVEDAVVNYVQESKVTAQTWEDLAKRGWKLCYVEDYS